MASGKETPCQGTVLIVDDSSGNCELCQIYLETEGFRVHIATNGQQGIEAIQRIRPDLILLDIMMPVMDGFQFLEQIKADPSSREIPVLVHSVRNETAAVVKALQMGAADFLKKPFDVDELIVRVKNQMAFKQARDAMINASAELVLRQQAIDAALEKWGREAEAFQKECERSVIGGQASSSADVKLTQAMSSSEQVRHLINRIVDLSRHRLPEYDVLN